MQTTVVGSLLAGSAGATHIVSAKAAIFPVPLPADPNFALPGTALALICCILLFWGAIRWEQWRAKQRYSWLFAFCAAVMLMLFLFDPNLLPGLNANTVL
jgi:hypothetical protein